VAVEANAVVTVVVGEQAFPAPEPVPDPDPDPASKAGPEPEPEPDAEQVSAVALANDDPEPWDTRASVSNRANPIPVSANTDTLHVIPTQPQTPWPDNLAIWSLSPAFSAGKRAKMRLLRMV
jgi:hypothetical protein